MHIKYAKGQLFIFLQVRPSGVLPNASSKPSTLTDVWRGPGWDLEGAVHVLS